jgi:hypothetical protein
MIEPRRQMKDDEKSSVPVIFFPKAPPLLFPEKIAPKNSKKSRKNKIYNHNDNKIKYFLEIKFCKITQNFLSRPF